MWCERQKKKNPTRAHQNSCEHCDDVMCVVQRSGFGAPKEFASKERRWLSGPAKALRNEERKRERRGRPIKALRFIVARRSLCFYVALCSSLRRLGALRWPAGTMVFFCDGATDSPPTRTLTSIVTGFCFWLFCYAKIVRFFASLFCAKRCEGIFG